MPSEIIVILTEEQANYSINYPSARIAIESFFFPSKVKISEIVAPTAMTNRKKLPRGNGFLSDAQLLSEKEKFDGTIQYLDIEVQVVDILLYEVAS